MFNASIIYFVIPFMSQAFCSLILSILSSLFPLFFFFRLINFLFYLSSFYSFILFCHSITESEEGRERIQLARKTKFVVIFVTSIYHVSNMNKTKTNILNLKLISRFSDLHGTKKLVSEEILISNSQTKAYLL